MKVIADKRRTGKTKKLIELAHETGAQLVCIDASTCEDVHDWSAKLGLYILKPITYTDLLNNKLYGKNVKKVIFDDVDIFLRRVAKNHEVEAIAINNDENEENTIPSW